MQSLIQRDEFSRNGRLNSLNQSFDSSENGSYALNNKSKSYVNSQRGSLLKMREGKQNKLKLRQSQDFVFRIKNRYKKVKKYCERLGSRFVTRTPQ